MQGSRKDLYMALRWPNAGSTQGLVKSVQMEFCYWELKMGLEKKRTDHVCFSMAVAYAVWCEQILLVLNDISRNREWLVYILSEEGNDS